MPLIGATAPFCHASRPRRGCAPGDGGNYFIVLRQRMYIHYTVTGQAATETPSPGEQSGGPRGALMRSYQVGPEREAREESFMGSTCRVLAEPRAELPRGVPVVLEAQAELVWSSCGALAELTAELVRELVQGSRGARVELKCKLVRSSREARKELRCGARMRSSREAL
eukprot:7344946-Alexandrium_andersonii.AAC.1